MSKKNFKEVLSARSVKHRKIVNKFSDTENLKSKKEETINSIPINRFLKKKFWRPSKTARHGKLNPQIE